jgi:beta-N-acetylhexosaminidase
MRTVFAVILSALIVLFASWHWANLPLETPPQDAVPNENSEDERAALTPDPAQAIGQLFMIGHWANLPVASTTEIIRKYGIGGVIIMSTPDNPEDIRDWVTKWQSVSSSTLFIAIDQEGGPVSRLRGPNYTATGQREISDTATAFAVGKSRGEELAALGITMNFAPVLDTAHNPLSFMYSRVFPNRDDSPRLAASLLDGMATAGVIGTVKHFPGHNDTEDDSHTVLPTVAITETELNYFVKPFAEILTTHPPKVLMTAHVVFPNIDPLPATLSPFWLTTYLRNTLHYDGVIITDDMIMDAIDQTWPHEEATVLALKAGADMILYAAEPEKVGTAIAAVSQALEEEKLSSSTIAASLNRIQNLKSHTQ